MHTGELDIAVHTAGSGPPLLLLHGYPQTSAMWRLVASGLAERHTVVAADLRGYGDSDKPAGAEYSKRAMAADLVAVMSRLGFEELAVVGHDRGARVAHRMALDHPGRVRRVAVIDIVPTYDVFALLDQAMATAYFHWFFLAQPAPLPERMIGADPGGWLRSRLQAWSGPSARFDPVALADYERCFADPATVHASCEDYRAGAGVDLEHDRADLDRRLHCPLLAVWGTEGRVGSNYDPLALWRARARDVRGVSVPGGHFCPEEAPEQTLAALRDFLAD